MTYREQLDLWLKGEAVRQLFIKAAQSKPKKNTIYISIPMELVGEIDKLIEDTK